MLSPYGQKLKPYPKELKNKILENMYKCKGLAGDLVLFDDRGFHGPDQPSLKDRKVIISEEHIDYEWLSFKDAYERLPWNGQKKGLSIVNDMITSVDDERLRWSEIQLTKDNKW